MDDSQLLQTREQEFKAKKWDRMFVSRSVIMSKAFLALKTPAACQIYLIFLNKCVWKEAQGKRKQKNNYYHDNNGEIQFSYKEAQEKFGISSGKFTRAIDELIRVGLIDIAHSGFGLHKDVTLYAISERWQQYGTDDFKIQVRKKCTGLGFRKGNTLGQHCKTERTVVNEDYVTVACSG